MINYLVFFGPSGVGKSTLISMLMGRFPDVFSFSVSHTTRQIRPGETDGIEYFFTDVESFMKGLDDGIFVEWTIFASNYYGTSKESLRRATLNGKICVLDLDINGVKSMMESKDFASLFILIKPKSIDDLKVRLHKRTTNGTNDDIDIRLEKAINDMSKLDEDMFDLVLINDDINETYEKLVHFLELY